MRGLASHCVWTNRSKESLTLNVKHPEAQSVLMRLVVERADVLVQNEAGLVSITGTPETPSKAGLSMVQRWATGLKR